MSFVIATCSHLLVGGYDISGDLTGLDVSYTSEGQDATTMGHDTRRVVGGLKTSAIAARGYLNLGSSQNEPVLFDNVGVDGTLVTAFLDGITTGSTTAVGYGMGTMQGSLNIGVNIGALVPFDLAAMNGSLLVKAVPLENWLSTALSTDLATGDSFNLGGAATSEQLYAGFHVTAVSTSLAGSVSAIIQAASSSGFGTANTRVSFSALSTKGGTLATPIAPSALSTDQPWYRSRITTTTGTSTGSASNGLIWMAIA
ncbi:MAG: hypothetical protein NUW22_12600 [Acidobacteria bacterium]|nr:hypothetical protein [Acidobacteriota bacterium]